MTQKRNYVIGLSISHNGAAILMRDGEVVCGIELERLTRIKRDGYENIQPAIDYCLHTAGITMDEVELKVYATTELLCPPDKYGLEINHHLAHAASAFYGSNFDQAAILVMDGSGNPGYWNLKNPGPDTCRREVLTTYIATESNLEELRKELAPNVQEFDLGIGGAFEFLSKTIFGDALEAGKVMGLAAYGRLNPTLPQLLDDRGKVRVGWFTELREFDILALHQDSQLARDLSLQVQQGLEHILECTLDELADSSNSTNVCLAGGVALNCVANARILPGPFKRFFVQPAANDAGLAFGCALYGSHVFFGLPLQKKQRRHIYFGRAYNEDETERILNQNDDRIIFESHEDVAVEAARCLASGEIVGWFQGGSEFGPRALGQRSILCDPRTLHAKAQLNDHVKHRESFRPFAASVLESEADGWFDKFQPSPYMVLAFDIKSERASLVPGVVHVDGTCRLQSICPADNELFSRLITAFFEETGIPMVLNTSFNVQGEPIVETIADAVECFLKTGLHVLFIGTYVVRRRDFSEMELPKIWWCLANKVELMIRSNDIYLKRPTAYPQQVKINPQLVKSIGFGLTPFVIPGFHEPWNTLINQGWFQPDSSKD